MTEFVPNLPDDAARAGVLVAWSGGLDSTVLLHLMQRWAQKTGAHLAAVHIDHDLRPTSAADATFCRRRAAKMGIPLVVERLRIRPDGSTQQNARLQRYAAIARVAARLGLGLVVTAHHADDALETALLNMRRGTSSGGMSALLRPGGAPIPSWSESLAIWRPLTGYTRAQILEFAERHQIKWHEDPTNATTDYARNALRIDVMDRLSDSGKYLRGMLDTLRNLADERDALEILAARALESAAVSAPDAEAIALRCAPIRALPAAIVAIVLQQAARRLPAEVALTRAHIQQVVDAICTGSSLRLDIRGGVVYVEKSFLLIEIARGRGGRFLHGRRAQPMIFGRTDKPTEMPWFGTSVRRKVQPLNGETSPGRGNSPGKNPEGAFYFETAARARLVLRGPEAGDRVNVRGIKGHKSLVDILSESGIPAFLRWRWPCLARADESREIQWVCGLRHAEAVRASHDKSPTEQDAALIIHYHWSVPPDSLFALLLEY